MTAPSQAKASLACMASAETGYVVSPHAAMPPKTSPGQIIRGITSWPSGWSE